MKVLLTSPDALINYEEQDFFPGIAEVLDKLEAEEIIAGTIVVSSNTGKLAKVPKKYNPIEVTHSQKQGRDFVNILVENLPEIAAHHDIMVLGANDGDLFMSSNSKLLLFSAQYAINNNSDDRVFQYGIPIYDPDHLYNFLSRYYDMGEQCFYELKVDDQTMLYSIINANFKYEDDRKLRSIRESIQDFLKLQTKVFGSLFNYYFLMSLYSKIDALRKIDYWSVYPSSRQGVYNEDLHILKEQARKLFKCRLSDEILIRTTDSTKRAGLDSSKRLQDACDEQLNTIIEPVAGF